MNPKVILSIAGSDNTGGAGIQADIKTCCLYRNHAATVITAVTAQNAYGVEDILYVGNKSLQAQLDTFFKSYIPDAIKIGMVPNPEAVEIISAALHKYSHGPIIIDPVMSATSGGSLTEDSRKTLQWAIKLLYPQAYLITPNIPELELIASIIEPSNVLISNSDRLKFASSLINRHITNRILLKGGHSKDNKFSTDWLSMDGYYYQSKWNCFPNERIDTPHSHGTGCILSTAIACCLAEGLELEHAIESAQNTVTRALINGREHSITDTYGPAQLAGL